MKPTRPYLVVSEFSGSQDGMSPGEVFPKDQQVQLTDFLAGIALAGKCVKGPLGPYQGEIVATPKKSGKKK